MNEIHKLKQLADTLFESFQTGDYKLTITLFAKDAKIIQQIGNPSPVNPEEFIQILEHGPLSSLGKPIYTDRRLQVIGQEGFIEQHTTELTIKGKTISFPACIIGKVNDVGEIILLEEYLDPTIVIKTLRELV
jgi:hypothetical protein